MYLLTLRGRTRVLLVFLEPIGSEASTRTEALAKGNQKSHVSETLRNSLRHVRKCHVLEPPFLHFPRL